ncbi:hypothetical protein KL921_002094 [Ogataea angusta]|uniref:Uncharacterized protein n=1 Tax=Pichia angusta TaxID=870730 RepID=A0AAN6DI11_PICAN|nr:uncharacterized protein KL928_002276 [Ogataea angusta]KAG7811828.1 hypothetical protein KL921_002094 [Ogataea angusta]KAG7819602.1 hypothetical protein KL928_002276 [Ogataea angusta]KAG7824383.1 hypothetical protein KL909_002381 [Ogataea angusta]KAG7835045.1 hypothetical protein KL943_002360 [Ogataea angusta]KAG7840531.1 hypothetical protein KL942_002482 [Ogataea angusta]
MGKQYISTAIVGDAHKSDILDVCVSKKYTVTCSADGSLKLWSNSSSDRPLETEVFVDKFGLHHVSLFETSDFLLIGTVSFSGKFYLYKMGDQLAAVDDIPAELKNEKCSFWALKFMKDLEEDNNVLAITTAAGETQIYNLQGETLTYSATTSSTDTSFATSVDLDPTFKRMAVGHQNGNVYIYDLEYLKPLYEFQSYGLKKATSSSSLSTVRCVRFSPGGTLLAVARDSGAYGTIFLYDVKYGEVIGTLTNASHSSNVGIGGFAHNSWCMSVSFNEDGTLLASGGLDDTIRVWSTSTRTKEASLVVSKSDVDDEALSHTNQLDHATCCALSFIPKGLVAGEGDNDGLVIVGFDRVIRWFREAGGV